MVCIVVYTIVDLIRFMNIISNFYLNHVLLFPCTVLQEIQEKNFGSKTNLLADNNYF